MIKKIYKEKQYRCYRTNTEQYNFKNLLVFEKQVKTRKNSSLKFKD